MSESFSWQTMDGLQIHGTHWAVSEPTAVIGLIHGLGEHVQRYTHFATYFNKRQIAVMGHDRRGHGQSEGKRGHTSNGINMFLDDIARLMVQVEETYPGRPIFLYGHSMGGNLLLNYLLRRHPSIKGAVVSAPHITLAFQPNPITLALGKVMRKMHPSFSQSNGLDLTALSRDQRVIEAYKKDPLVHDRLTAETGMAMLDAAFWLDHYGGQINIPLLLLHGGADRITNPDGTRRFDERIKGDVRLKIWEGLYHEIHNEPEQMEVLSFVYNWMQEKL